MQKKLSTLLSALLAVLVMTGCEEAKTAAIAGLPEGKTILFYENGGTQLLYHTDEKTQETLSETNASARLLYWDDNETEKVVLLDANLSHVHYIAHMDGETFIMESNATSAELLRLQTYLSERNDTQGFLEGNLTSVCRFFTYHDAEDHTEVLFAVTNQAQLYVYEANQTKRTGPVTLDGATACDPNRSGFTSVADGVLLFLGSVQKIYGIDTHGGDFHVHTIWNMTDLLNGFVPDQMAGFGMGAHEAH